MDTHTEEEKTVTMSVAVSESAREKLGRLKGIYGCKTINCAVSSVIEDVVLSDVLRKATEKELVREGSTPELVSSDKVDHITELKEFYENLRNLVIQTYPDADPDGIDMKYILTTFKYLIPALDDIYALIGDNDKHKMLLAVDILGKFDLKTMTEYEDLIKRGKIDLEFIDNRTRIATDVDKDKMIAEMDVMAGEE